MIQNVYITFWPFLISFLICLSLTPIIIIVFKKFGFVVDPKKNPHPAHIHKEPTPKGGGIPILMAILITTLLFLKPDQHILAILIASSLTVFVGVIDDIKGLNPYFRLGINLLSTLIIVASGIGIAFVSNPMGGIIDLSWPRFNFYLWGQSHEIWILADIFAIIWIPALMNAINWSSGVDGQISGVITIAAFVLGMISLNFSADITQWPVATLAFAMSGAFLAFTIFHFYPQKIMPGYSATSLAGLLLGVISILSTAKVGALTIVLGVPLVDFVYLVIRRISSGKSPVWGDKNHLHHKLLDLGWGKRRVAFFYWSITGLLGIIALNFTAYFKLLVMIGLVLLMVVFLIWQYFSRSSRRSDLGNG